ncbi:MAG: hypothetical protein DMF64_17190 [Acidobacteria bacterium]|nr:MAG: hypothetical protein DMF64_17190 [Acidobacteriota bacterium]
MIDLRKMLEKIKALWKCLWHWKWAERFKVLLEIVAIVIAAGWTIYLYRENRKASRITAFDLNGNLTWAPHSKDTCEADFKVEIHNVGNSTVKISRVSLSAWSLNNSYELPPNETVRPLEPLNMRVAPALMQQDTDRLLGRYAPGEENQNDFSLVVRRSRGKLILFEADFWQESDIGNADPSWRAWQWDWVCGEALSAAEAKPK